MLSFNLLALFGAGMSQDGVHFGTWFAILASFVIWGIFYLIQFSRSNNKTWRISWFGVMVVLLFFWETGLGTTIGGMIG